MKNPKTKIFALAMAAALVMSLTVSASAASFPDMPTGWSKDAMQAAVDNGLFEGTEDGRINPTGELTRAELAKVIATAFGATEAADLTAYTDVNGAWYTQPMAVAVKMGVINGTGAASMSPTRKVTRQEAATILARALKLDDGTAEDLAEFTDAGEVGSWFVGPMAAMVKAGYLKGSDGKLNPGDIMTRESLAVMMYNIFTTYIREAGEVTEVPEGNVIVTAPGVTLKGVTITGDLIIGDGVGEGDVTIDGCTVNGRMVVRGGGVNSIHVIKTVVSNRVLVNKTTGSVRIVTDSESTVSVAVTAITEQVVLEGNYATVEVGAAQAPVALQNATVETVAVITAGAEVSMTNTTAVTVTVSQSAKVELTGDTKITTMAVTSTDVTVATEEGVVISTVKTDVTVVVTGEGVVENTEGSGEVVDTPPVDPSPAPTESTDPEPAESSDPTDVGVTEPTAPAHVHSAVYKYNAEKHWQVCSAAGHTDDDDFANGTAENGTAHTLTNGKCVCGYTVSVTVPADKTPCANDAHTWGSPVPVAATCIKEGTNTYTCSVETCGATKVETIAKVDHSFTVEKAAATDSTCTVAGKTALMGCATEGCTATTGGEAKELAAHNLGAFENDGTYHWKKCSVCERKLEYARHSYADSDPWTCTCGKVDPAHDDGSSEPPVDPTDPPEGTPHTHGSWTYAKKDATQHTKTCGAAGCTTPVYTEDEAHSWAAATGKCSACDQDCPNASNHANIEQGQTCGTCGLAGTKDSSASDPNGGSTAEP